MKKYLIINNCQSCPMRTYDHENNRFYCNEEDLTVPYHHKKGFPTWCPLDNLPPNKEKK